MRKFSWGVFYATPLVLFILFAVPAVYADTYIGDSIALGAGHAAHQTTYARVGVGSCWMDRRAPSSLPNFILSHHRLGGSQRRGPMRGAPSRQGWSCAGDLDRPTPQVRTGAGGHPGGRAGMGRSVRDLYAGT
jgi:hypothetical protein